VLVNNAGIMPLSTIADTDDAAFGRLIDVNLKGTFNTLREAARRLRNGGRIGNFSSSVVALLQPTYGVYAATKAAVEAMTSVLAKELRGGAAAGRGSGSTRSRRSQRACHLTRFARSRSLR
jgi:3-oxoacyl-[acyl-carrier protein] reductase